MSDGEFQIPEWPELDEYRLTELGRLDWNQLKKKPMTGIELITNERLEQKVKHGYSPRNDFENNKSGELVRAAITLLEENKGIYNMPENWDQEICRKMIEKPYEARLVIAGALIAAEIDRLNYKP